MVLTKKTTLRMGYRYGHDERVSSTTTVGAVLDAIKQEYPNGNTGMAITEFMKKHFEGSPLDYTTEGGSNSPFYAQLTKEELLTRKPYTKRPDAKTLTNWYTVASEENTRSDPITSEITISDGLVALLETYQDLTESTDSVENLLLAGIQSNTLFMNYMGSVKKLSSSLYVDSGGLALDSVVSEDSTRKSIQTDEIIPSDVTLSDDAVKLIATYRQIVAFPEEVEDLVALGALSNKLFADAMEALRLSNDSHYEVLGGRSIYAALIAKRIRLSGSN